MFQANKLLAAMILTASFPAWSADYRLVYSETNDRAGSISLDGATVSGDLYGRVEPDTGDIEEVRFYLDGSPRLFHDEGTAPYELQGGRATARPWDTEDLDDGSHSIRTEVELDDGSVFSFDTHFVIANSAPPAGNVAPQLSSIPDQRVTAGQAARSLFKPVTPMVMRSISAPAACRLLSASARWATAGRSCLLSRVRRTSAAIRSPCRSVMVS